MNDFVGLNIEAPFVLAKIESLVGLFTEDQATFGLSRIPKGINKLDFGIVQRSDHLTGIVVALPDGHHKLVDNRQDAPKAFEHGVTHKTGISNDSESAQSWPIGFHRLTTSNSEPMKQGVREELTPRARLPILEGVRKLLLVIEDYAELISLESLLRRVGFDVLSLSREASVAETVLAFTPDLLLATYRGRNIDGPRLAHRLKTQVGHRLRVVYILPVGSDPKDSSMANSGSDAWLPLPIDHVRTLRILSRVLNLPVEPLVEKLGKIESARLAESDEMYMVHSSAQDRGLDQKITGDRKTSEVDGGVAKSSGGGLAAEAERLRMVQATRRRERYELALRQMQDEAPELPPLIATQSIKLAGTQLKEYVHSQPGEEDRLQQLDAEKRRFVVALLKDDPNPQAQPGAEKKSGDSDESN